MRTIEDYMAMPYRMEIVEDSDEGGFVASYPDLPGCISCGETVEVPCGAFSARGHKHEPVLRISPFPQRRRIFKVTSLPFRNISPIVAEKIPKWEFSAKFYRKIPKWEFLISFS